MANQWVTIISLVLILIVGAVILNSVRDLITGAVVTCKIECRSNADCDDSNDCTNDACMYPKSCESLCYHSLVEDCR